jgi:uncharacterized protein YdeI (YjbR/CyaY-like superfamily)
MQKTFRAQLQPLGDNLHWIVAHVPFDPRKAWPDRIGLRVKGTINGFPFRTSLFGAQDGSHFLLVNKQMQRGGSVTTGGLAQFTLEPDMEERTATPPPELAKLLNADRALKKWHGQLNYSMRKYMADEVNKPKSLEARIRRAEQLAEMMMLAMEGEQELPPILQVAFRRQPQALTGWQSMTPIQRKTHLLAIFHCQGTESRAKRAQKAVEDALRIAARKNKSRDIPSANDPV